MSTDRDHRRIATGEDGARPVVALTRIRLKHAWLVVPALIRFRRLYAGAHADPGFVRGQVAVAGPRTLVNLSVWRSRWAMLRWSGQRGHVDAVRWTYARAAEVWSAEWELIRVSASAGRWHGELLLELPPSSAQEVNSPIRFTSSMQDR